ARELSARKLAVQKAEIALERAKLRLEGASRSESGVKSNQSATKMEDGGMALGYDPQKIQNAVGRQRAGAYLHLKLVPANAGALGNGRCRGGMKVTEVIENGVADTAGIRVNDILIGLEKWEITGYQDLAYVLKHWNYSDGTPLNFRLIRDNAVIEGKLFRTEA